MGKEKMTELVQLAEDNAFYSRMGTKHLQHLGLFGIAVYLRHSMKEENDKAPKIIMLLTQLLLIFDDLEILLYNIKKTKRTKKKINKKMR